MTTLTNTTSAPFGSIATFRAIEKLDNVKNAYIGWRSKRETISALSKLSARELDDLGIVRGDIDAIASRASRF